MSWTCKWGCVAAGIPCFAVNPARIYSWQIICDSELHCNWRAAYWLEISLSRSHKGQCSHSVGKSHALSLYDVECGYCWSSNELLLSLQYHSWKLWRDTTYRCTLLWPHVYRPFTCEWRCQLSSHMAVCRSDARKKAVYGMTCAFRCCRSLVRGRKGRTSVATHWNFCSYWHH